MVQHGIILGHEDSEREIEFDKVKVEVIAKLPKSKCVKDIRSFLGHGGFVYCLIKDFSKIVRTLTNLLAKNMPFDFNNECLITWETLKKELISEPIIHALE